MLMLKLNGVAMPFAAGRISQRYADFGGFSTLRMHNGSALQQEHWRKLTTTISGQGWIPPALAGVDWSAPVTVDCVGQRAVSAVGPSMSVPAARRSDVPPFGFAVLPTGMIEPTDVAMVGDVANLTPVATAMAYQVVYYPRFVGESDGPQEAFDFSDMAASWELVLREV